MGGCFGKTGGMRRRHLSAQILRPTGDQRGRGLALPLCLLQSTTLISFQPQRIARGMLATSCRTSSLDARCWSLVPCASPWRTSDDQVLKILLVGDSNVGKTSLICQYAVRHAHRIFFRPQAAHLCAGRHFLGRVKGLYRSGLPERAFLPCVSVCSRINRR